MRIDRLRVLVVDDSLTVRKKIVEVLSGDPALEVVAEAADGKRAIELCQALRPDVVTLDMMLPIMTGLAVTEHVMAYFPTPILIVSASLNRGEVFRTFDALAAGAVDVLEKPLRDAFERRWEERLVAAVKLVARVPVITHPRAKLKLPGAAPRRRPAPLAEEAGPRPPPLAEEAGPRPPPLAEGNAFPPALIAIGASTGGPAALVEVLSRLSPSFPIPIAIVIHIGQAFLLPLVQWLGEHSAVPVRVAEEGAPLPRPGEPTVLVAPADCHLTVRGGVFRLTSDPERHSCRPSVDVLFESVARDLGPRAVGCLLTGMGRDGAAGLLAMRRAGGVTLVQDEATSAVYGMPREACLLGAAQQVLPIHEIAKALARYAAL